MLRCGGLRDPAAEGEFPRRRRRSLDDQLLQIAGAHVRGDQHQPHHHGDRLEIVDAIFGALGKLRNDMVSEV